jgi:hypothetical protein
MCYCIPTSIEVSIDDDGEGASITQDELSVVFGYEYILYDDDSIPDPEPVSDILMGIKTKTISKQVQCDRPCTYITLSVGFMKTSTAWCSVRIYGQAISFV